MTTTKIAWKRQTRREYRKSTTNIKTTNCRGKRENESVNYDDDNNNGNDDKNTRDDDKNNNNNRNNNNLNKGIEKKTTTAIKTRK